MKIKLVTTYPPTHCGMAEHSERMVNSLKKVGVFPEIVDIKKPNASNPFYFRHLAKKAVKGMTKKDIIHIEFNLGVFGKLFGILPGFYILTFLRLVKKFGKAKIVITMHDSSTKSSAKNLGIKGILFFYYYKFLTSFLKKFPDKMIFHSEFGKNIAVKEWNFDENKIIVIPFGSPMNRKSLNKNICKKKLGFANKKILLILGYIREVRDYEMVLEALNKLDEDVVLIIAGEVQLKKHQVIKENILKKTKKLKLDKRVKLTGYVEEEDMPILLNATDVGIIPYKKAFGDFYSATLTTQLAYFIPLLTTNLPVFERLKKGGKCIETYDKESIEDLIEKIKSLLYDKEKITKLKKYSKEYWKTHNWDSVGKKKKELYMSLIKKI